eukprot:GHVU01211536.1.p1 GENE.GHVU01211536.1~~GHVU01211536.1.p1  ORF type:complete len:132 (-),score=6.62 GHVU01211536.1:693-1088(-)
MSGGGMHSSPATGGGRGGGGSDVMPFGKHRGCTYEELVTRDPNYCTWCLNQDDGATGAMRAFIDYLKTNSSLRGAPGPASGTPRSSGMANSSAGSGSRISPGQVGTPSPVPGGGTRSGGAADSQVGGRPMA